MFDSHATVYGRRRPHRSLLPYYVLSSFALGPLFPLLLLPNVLRYRTLRYEFDEEGVSVRWGFFFRREISLNYRRIQDIHLTSNLLERWLGLARVQIQTAAGSSRAEMTIEGLRDFEEIRDFLYSRMRGHREPAAELSAAGAAEAGEDPLVSILRQVVDELRALRRTVEARAAETSRATGDPEAPP